MGQLDSPSTTHIAETIVGTTAYLVTTSNEASMKEAGNSESRLQFNGAPVTLEEMR